MEVDFPEPSYEFSTLKGQWSLTDSPTITVHLKVAFCDEAADDQARMAMQVTAIVDDIVGDCVVYGGFVVGNKAADQTLNSGVRHDFDDDDKSAAVRVWLRSARAALVGSGGKPTTEYEYHLRREDDDNDQLLTLAWKMKLRPFGLATLGMVQMTEVTPKVKSTVSLTCTSFITPLISLLSAERKQQKLSDLGVADRERCQLEDNRRLLEELRLMADSQRLVNHRMMAQFVEVLNAKKRRILDLQQELANLKLEPDVPRPDAIAVEQKKVIVRQRRGRGTCRGRPGPIKKIRRSTTHSDMKKFCSSSSEDENVAQRHVNSSVQWPELEEINKLNCDNISGNVVVDPEETPLPTSIPVSPTTPVSPRVSPILPVSTDMDVSVDPRYYTDTQIDSPNSSPPWLQQPLTVSPSPQLQPSINQLGEHQLPKKKSVLDDLWSGIV